VPKRIRDIMSGHTVRNVWAHRAGYADQKFVERCPDLGVALVLGGYQCDRIRGMMHGMHMYVVVLNNRLRLQNGQPALVVECIGYEGCSPQRTQSQWLGRGASSIAEVDRLMTPSGNVKLSSAS